MYDLIIRNARIHGMNDEISQSAESLAVTGGRIARLDPPAGERAKKTIDAAGQLLLPGFVDCHTHAVYAGNRMNEHVMKLNGASYAEIAQQGGGIASTVNAVRNATLEELCAQSLPRLNALLAEGVTTVEIKSGYGLDTANEIKMLRAIKRLRKHTHQQLVATFLGAHAVPQGQSRSDYIDSVVTDMLPKIAQDGLAEAVDIFVEHIAFDLNDMQRVFAQAERLGFKLKAHTDQLSNMGGTTFAARHRALSCEHLEYANTDDVAAMAEHQVVAVLLPGAFYCLKEKQLPPIALFRKQRVAMAIATDLNPGSSPVASLLTVLHMACTLFGLTAREALLGVTRNAARALGHDDIGVIRENARADFTLWDIPSPEFLTYQLGGLRPTKIFIEGHKQ